MLSVTKYFKRKRLLAPVIGKEDLKKQLSSWKSVLYHEFC